MWFHHDWRWLQHWLEHRRVGESDGASIGWLESFGCHPHGHVDVWVVRHMRDSSVMRAYPPASWRWELIDLPMVHHRDRRTTSSAGERPCEVLEEVEGTRVTPCSLPPWRTAWGSDILLPLWNCVGVNWLRFSSTIYGQQCCFAFVHALRRKLTCLIHVCAFNAIKLFRNDWLALGHQKISGCQHKVTTSEDSWWSMPLSLPSSTKGITSPQSILEEEDVPSHF